VGSDHYTLYGKEPVARGNVRCRRFLAPELFPAARVHKLQQF